LDTRIITRKELDVLGQRNTDKNEIERALHMIYRDEVSIMQLVTKTIAFEEMAGMVAHMAEHPDENIKVMTLLA
jgi:threonine dehydrogenase-like Zn-dependent dehydrogenase